MIDLVLILLMIVTLMSFCWWLCSGHEEVCGRHDDFDLGDCDCEVPIGKRWAVPPQTVGGLLLRLTPGYPIYVCLALITLAIVRISRISLVPLPSKPHLLDPPKVQAFNQDWDRVQPTESLVDFRKQYSE